MKTPTIEEMIKQIVFEPYITIDSVFLRIKELFATQIKQAKKEERDEMVKEIEKYKEEHVDKSFPFPTIQEGVVNELLESIKRT